MSFRWRCGFLVLHSHMSILVYLCDGLDWGDVFQSRISTLVCFELVVIGRLGLAVQYLGDSNLVFALGVQSQLVRLGGVGF